MSDFLKTVRGDNNTLIEGGGRKELITCHEPRLMNKLGDDEIFLNIRNFHI